MGPWFWPAATSLPVHRRSPTARARRHQRRAERSSKSTTCSDAPTMADISAMRLDIVEIQKALKDNKSWKVNVANTLQQKVTEDIVNLKNEMNTKLDHKVGLFELDGLKTTIRHDITIMEKYFEEYRTQIARDTGRSFDAVNGRIDLTNKDLAVTKASLQTTFCSLSECYNKVACVHSDMENVVADTEAILKRHVLSLREDVNNLTVKSVSHETDIQKIGDAVRKMESQKHMDSSETLAEAQDAGREASSTSNDRALDLEIMSALREHRTPPYPKCATCRLPLCKHPQTGEWTWCRWCP